MADEVRVLIHVIAVMAFVCGLGFGIGYLWGTHRATARLQDAVERRGRQRRAGE
jgi:hypothetical protein